MDPNALPLTSAKLVSASTQGPCSIGSVVSYLFQFAIVVGLAPSLAPVPTIDQCAGFPVSVGSDRHTRPGKEPAPLKKKTTIMIHYKVRPIHYISFPVTKFEV